MLIILMIILIPVGIGFKLYSGSGHSIISNKIPGLIYVVFWSFFAASIWVRHNPLVLVIWVLIITCGLEFLQLYANPMLTMVRSTFFGRALIGNSFSFTDFGFYLGGALLAYLWLQKINKAYLIK